MSDADAIRKHLLEAHGLVVESEMTQFVARRLADAGSPATFHVMGGDARTGVPIRKPIDAAAFRALPQPPR